MIIVSPLRSRTRSLRPGKPASRPNQVRRIVGSTFVELPGIRMTLIAIFATIASNGRPSTSIARGPSGRFPSLPEGKNKIGFPLSVARHPANNICLLTS